MSGVTSKFRKPKPAVDVNQALDSFISGAPDAAAVNLSASLPVPGELPSEEPVVKKGRFRPGKKREDGSINPNNKIQISLTINEGILDTLEAKAKKAGITRAAWIGLAIAEKLQLD